MEYIIENGQGYVKIYNSYNTKLEFEGEYFKGEKNGKGKEYYYDGLIRFEGEYLYNERKKGKEYYYNGKLKFEGEYLYNQRKKGKFYIDNRLEYEGEYLYNKKCDGKCYDENGKIIYELINGTGKVKEYNDYFNGII